MQVGERTLLEMAAENIHDYKWALSRWLSKDENYSPGYLILEISGSRNRAKRILELLKKTVNSDLNTEVVKLEMRFSELEKEFMDKFNFCDNETMKEIMNDYDGVGYFLSLADNLIQKFINIAEDGEIIGFDLVEESLRDVGMDFLMLFQDITHFIWLVKDNLDTEVSKNLIQAYNAIEDKFKHNFAYFAHLKDVLKSIREREYTADFWWLKLDPGKVAIEEESVLDSIWNELARHIEERKTCDFDDDEVIAYAMGVLRGDRRNRIREHIYTCDYCLDLVLDVRLGMSEARKMLYKEIEVPEWFMEKVKLCASELTDISLLERESDKEKPSDSPRGILAFLKTLSFEIFEYQPTPISLPVAAGHEQENEIKDPNFEFEVHFESPLVLFPKRPENLIRGTRDDLDKLIGYLERRGEYFCLILGKVRDGDVVTLLPMKRKRGIPLRVDVPRNIDEVWLFISFKKKPLERLMRVSSESELRDIRDIIKVKFIIKGNEDG